MKHYSILFSLAVCIPMAFIAAPASRSLAPTGCTGPLATFCSVSANCIEAGNILANTQTVSGLVTAGSFATPAGPLVSGISNYAVLLNSFFVTSGDYALWGDTPAGNISAGITLDPTTGYVTLPTGLFLVQYTAKFYLPPSTFGSGYAILAQGPAGGPLVLLDAPPVAIMGISGDTDDSNSSEPLVTGDALILVTSAANNTIGLNIQSYNGMILAGQEGDENAELVILQLN